MRDFDWQIITALHKTGSITKTADLLFMSQPALTKRIQAIESELGVTLIVRSRQGSAFTPEGERIALKAEWIVNAIRNVMEDASEHSSGEKGSIRLGVPYSYVRYIAPKILASYMKKYPKVNVDIVTMASNDLITCVEDGAIDVCFARYSAENSSLQRILFSEDRACIISSERFEKSDLQGMPYIDFPRNPGSQSAIQRWWNESFSYPQNLRLKVTTADACVAMVEQGLGYGIIMDERYIRPENNIYSIPLEYADGTFLSRKSYVFYQKESEANTAVLNFIRLVEETDVKTL